MKSNQKLFVLFWLKKSKITTDGTAPVYVRITIDGLSDEISTGLKAPVEHWDIKTKTVLYSAPKAKIINQKIHQVEFDLDRHFLLLQTQHQIVTPQMLKIAFTGKSPSSKKALSQEIQQTLQHSLLEAFNSFIEKFEEQVKQDKRDGGTLRQWKTARRKVAAFLKNRYKVKDIDLKDIEPGFAEDFYDYLTIHCSDTIAEVTAKKHVKRVRQIIKPAVIRKIIASNPLDGFNCSAVENEVQPLEMHQVEAIYRKPLTVKRMIEVRDAFIFQCFTGFAYQDIYDLTTKNIIKVGNKAEPWLIKERGKTKVSQPVPILPIVAELIEKYKNHPVRKVTGRLIPVNSNYRYNVYLKELADVCGVTFDDVTVRKQEFNTHLARHTFAHIMLNNGVPLEDVSRMMGHRSIRTTQRYARVNRARISESVLNVRTKLFTKAGKLRAIK
ncbi:Site-specific recombinase XerD [Dyadobacter soli]|uniref:Site-specific recombinase XerD n=1 Tax=Dyadobacter soli TaxID=659014 RepID=A0A1G7MPL1_9BACT|nr:site-specific integrase [Dyadobacter soli]SDF63732.1 Site-specific recombinase XerD [Dyadobacter soli]